MASKNVLVGAIEFGILVLQRVKILAHAGKTDNVMSCAAYQAAHFDNRSVSHVLSWFLFVADFGESLSQSGHSGQAIDMGFDLQMADVNGAYVGSKNFRVKV